MNRRVKNAVLRVGGIARSLEDGGTFAASIQPERRDGDGRTEIGTGFLRKFTMYTVCDGAAGALRQGSLIEYRGERYAVTDIETYRFHGEPVFRRGAIILERTGKDGESDGA